MAQTSMTMNSGRRCVRKRRRWCASGVLAITLLLTAAPAYADGTIFLGVNSTPNPVVGISGGQTRGRTGWELEYAVTRFKPTASRPSLYTVTGNFLVYGTENERKIRPFGLVGFGAYGESRADGRGAHDMTYVVGGGARWRLAGVAGLRFDYRLFFLKGPADERPSSSVSHRLAVGLNLAF